MKKKIVVMMLVLNMALTPAGQAIASSDNEKLYNAYAEQIAEQYGICPELIEAMIFTESGYNPNATSSCGAQGLMQIMPGYQRERMKRLGITNLYDPYSNILCGVDIIAEYAEEYEPYMALAAYNCGEYSTTFKKLLNGEISTWAYSDKVLEKSAELERANGK